MDGNEVLQAVMTAAEAAERDHPRVCGAHGTIIILPPP